MHLPRFEYFVPKTIEEACSILSKYEEEARIMAGGTDLLVRMKERMVTPKYLVNIKAIPDLDYISYDHEKGLRIGALTTFDSIENSLMVQEKFPILVQTAGNIASPQIRNMGTIGGNLCHAAPSADAAPPLIALGAKIKISSFEKERIVAVEDFYIDPFKTLLDIPELLTEIQVPNLPPHSGGIYLKHSLRETMDIAIVGVAVVITLDSTNEVCNDIRIVLGAVAPTPIRAKRAEEVLKGKILEQSLIEEAAQVASEEARPISDVRSSAEYRKGMVKVITRRATSQAWKLARSA